MTAEQRKQHILEASLQLFKSHPYNSIVMEDIAKASNIARTTLYDYYSNKESILVALLEQTAFNARKIEIRGKSAKETFEFFAEDYLTLIQENLIIYRILYQVTPLMTKELTKKMHQWRDEHANQIVALAQVLQDNSLLRETVDLNDVLFVFQGLLSQKINTLLLTNTTLNPKTEAKHICDLLWYGVVKREIKPTVHSII